MRLAIEEDESLPDTSSELPPGPARKYIPCTSSMRLSTKYATMGHSQQCSGEFSRALSRTPESSGTPLSTAHPELRTVTSTSASPTVVVGIDLSPMCRRALEAASLIAQGDGAKLYAVHVLPERAAAFARLRGEPSPDLDAFVHETASEYPGLAAHAKVLPYSGHRSGVLVFAALADADLVAVGTRGQGNLRDVVVGCAAEKVLRDSACGGLAAKPRAVIRP